MVWTTPIDEDGVEVDLNKGEALLKLKKLCSVFDAFTVPNSFDPLHALGFVGAVISSLRIRWEGITNTRSFNNGSTFRANSVETSATIDLTVETPATKPPFTPSPRDGFRFIADPSSTITHFAQIVQENNGALF